MPGPSAFEVEGVVVAVLSPRTCTLELSNGHRLLGYQPGTEMTARRLAFGDRVIVRISPYDLSEGRILLEKKKL